MVRSEIRPASTERQQEMNASAADGGSPPMSLQDAGDCHGHEMHPQKLVRLVGCHDSNAASPKAPARKTF